MSRTSLPTGRQALDGTVRIFLAEALLLPTGILASAFLTRRFGPEGYGAYALAASLLLWLELTLVSFFNRTTTKLVAEAEDWRPVAGFLARAHLLSGLGLMLLVCALAEPLAWVLNEPRLTLYLRLASLDIPVFLLAQAHRNTLIGLGKFRERAVATVGRSITRLALVFLLVQAGLSIPGALLATVGASVAELLLCRLHIRPGLRSRLPEGTPGIWEYALPLFLAAGALRLFDKIDLMALKVFGLPTEEAGFYSAAQNLAIVPGLFATSLAPLLLASVSRLTVAGDREGAARMIREGLRAVLLLIPAVTILAAGSEGLVRLIYGDAFIPAAPLFAILGFGGAGFAGVSVVIGVLTARDRPHWSLWLTGPLILLALVGHWLLVPQFGGIGAAAVSTVCGFLGAAGGFLMIHRLCGVAAPLHTLVRSLAASGVIWVLGAAWNPSGPAVVLKLALLSVAGLAALHLLGEFKASEIRTARSLIGWRTASAEG